MSAHLSTIEPHPPGPRTVVALVVESFLHAGSVSTGMEMLAGNQSKVLALLGGHRTDFHVTVALSVLIDTMCIEHVLRRRKHSEARVRGWHSRGL